MTQTLHDIQRLLTLFGLRPKKRLGQNFLHDANHIRRIIEAGQIRPGDLVLEIGPGTGALSEGLLEAGAHLVAVEIDGDLEPLLRQRLTERFGDRVELYIGDVLAGKHQLQPQVMRLLRGRPFKLAANLPYNIASPLLVNLVTGDAPMQLAVVTVQRDVAQRITAQPGGGDYGPLGIMINAMCRVEGISTLSPSCFWPKPKVESSVVKLIRREVPLTNDPRKLGRLVHRLFTQRRKQIGTILGHTVKLGPGVEAAMRPQELTVDQLVDLAGRTDDS